MKAKNILLISCLLISGIRVAAQNVSYKVTSDDPSRIKPFSISLEPLVLDMHVANMTFGYSLRADLLFLNRLEFRGDFRKSYFDMNANDAKETLPLAKNGVKKSSFYEAGATLFLFDKVKRRNLKIVLSSTRIGNYEYTRYIMVPGNKRKMWGVRGGLYNLSTAFIFEKGTHSYTSFKNGADEVQMDATLFSRAIAMTHTPVLHAGIHWKSITNLFVSTDYGTRGNSGVNDFFIDFLYAPAILVSDIKNPDGTIWDVNVPAANKRNIGWRAGWIIRRPESTFMSCKMEIGSRPGIRSKGGLSLYNETVYMMMTLGVNIPARIKKLDKKS
jgi:hypothetical protein